MKLQHLTVIFILIILPVIIVVSEYIDNQIDRVNLVASFDRKLLNSTYDAIKAYKINTVTNAISDISNSKIKDIEATVKTFYNSLSTSFGYTGYKSKVMESYVPAVVFALYDGYYIYSPFQNVLTSVKEEEKDLATGTIIQKHSIDETTVDENYENEKTLNGLKPYIYYSCRYTPEGTSDDFVINYTLDNYITIQGTINGKYVYDYGYLISGITLNGDGSYEYDGVKFYENDTENLSEYLGDTLYEYVKINGRKYYLQGDGTSEEDNIFYIDNSGNKMVQTYNTVSNREEFMKYYNAIKHNKSSYEYYKNAYRFYRKIMTSSSGIAYQDDDGTNVNGYGLKDVNVKDAQISNTNTQFSDGTYSFGNYKIFDDTSIALQDSDSNFNQHRAQVIRYAIETNLSTSITAYSNYSNADTVFTMPKISETDWEMLENNVCIATFLQGMKVGGKTYNSYSVVANTLTKEYVDENDIYILKNDNTYAKTNDNLFLQDSTQIKNITDYQPAFSKIDFERKRVVNSANELVYYYPKSYESYKPYLASYTSVVGSTTLNSLDSKEAKAGEYTDMYKYMRRTDITIPSKLKEVYYKALGRERWSSYNEANHDTELNYFLNSY